MTSNWSALADKLNAATGPDAALDAIIADVFGVNFGRYTESIEHCRQLVAKVLPGWRLHVGFDGSGVSSYASVSNGENRVEATAPTLPLAILRALGELARLNNE
jgi:hypothetical protein